MMKTLAIIGGMGPKASILLHTQLLSEIPKYKLVTNDQDFPNIIHLSFSEDITDRMRYLLGEEIMNPAHEVFEQVKYLQTLSQIKKTPIIVGIPCNTFHAPSIYDVLLERMTVDKFFGVELIHLIDETIIEIEDFLTQGTCVGVFSTTGEWKMEIYESSLAKKGYKPLPRDEALQMRIQECIYNEEWGLKTSSTNYNKSVQEVLKIIKHFKEKGAEAIIWGCTEFSLISEEIQDPDLFFFDSTKILTNRMISRALL